MFEFRLALKYLLPKKGSLSTSLISLMSVLVISLVIWLILVFLSVTSGLEKNWLTKLTSINAPLQISPTDRYYSSYYYQIDGLSADSGYQFKTIQEKYESERSNPYEEGIDQELPHFFARPDKKEGKLLDPVKTLYSSLDEMQKRVPSLTYQEYELSGALMRLAVQREDNYPLEQPSFISQMSYLISFPENNPHLEKLLVPITSSDIEHIASQLGRSHHEWLKDYPTSSAQVTIDPLAKRALYDHLEIQEVKLKAPLRISDLTNGHYRVFVDASSRSLYLNPPEKLQGKWAKLDKSPSGAFLELGEKKYPLQMYSSLYTGKETFIVKRVVNGSIEIELFGALKSFNIDEVEILTFKPKLIFSEKPEIEPYWPYFFDNKWHLPEKERPGILLPKNYKKSHVQLGDSGYLSYVTPTTGSTQEMRQEFYVAGFYDPGVMPIGAKALFVPSYVTRTINASSQAFSPDNMAANGLFVWFDPLQKTDAYKLEIASLLQKEGALPYWKLTGFTEYEFSEGLMKQFQSDRTLFLLIALIIIVVACSNIISFLVILVKDKQKEIAILSAMGASKRSIVFTFAIAGGITGALSSVIGTLAAIFTLKHLDLIVLFLSKIQGHDAFQEAFFGESLPNELSLLALQFVLITTPIISIIAGLIPALKASKLQPSSILRSQ